MPHDHQFSDDRSLYYTVNIHSVGDHGTKLVDMGCGCKKKKKNISIPNIRVLNSKKKKK